MAKDTKRTPELIDTIAEFLGVDIVNREAFADCVNGALAQWIIPRLYVTQLKQDGIISPKKASDGPRSTGGVTTT
jgi:hypothetical protein